MQPFRAHLLEQKLLEIIQDAYAQGWKDGYNDRAAEETSQAKPTNDKGASGIRPV